MPVDLVKEVVGTKHAYANSRGADKAKGIGGSVPGTLIPRTTWGDVIVIASHLEKYIDPTPQQCIDLLTRETGDRSKAIGRCGFGGRGQNPRVFSRTSAFQRDQKLFRESLPSAKASFFELPGKVISEEVYPHNEEFWGRAIRYAIARSAAGVVPTWDELVVESVSEAIEELPETLKSVFDAADPRNFLPDPTPWVELIKWGSIAGALGLLYWYVLRPKK